MNMLRYMVLLSLFFSQLAAAERAIKFVITDMIVQYGGQTFSEIAEQANVSLSATSVHGMTHVNGNLTAYGAQLADIVVNGSASLANCTINGSISVYGELQLQNCLVKGEISTYHSILSLTSCRVDTIINLNTAGEQNIFLQGGSVVNGAITFLSGNGIVSTSSSSFLSGGVNGGKVVRS